MPDSRMSTRKSGAATAALAGALCLLIPASLQAGNWYPVAVDVWDPPFNSERRRSTQIYKPLAEAEKRWNICVSIPHLKDAYWLAVDYGLVNEARRLGVNLEIYEAGGYDRLAVQREQVEDCLAMGIEGGPVDGLILSAIDADGMNDIIDAAHASGVPVVDLINGVTSANIAARAAVSYYDAGYQAGEYLRNLEAATTGEARVAWFPGPEGAAWMAAGDAGFNAALAGSNIKIIATRAGDTGKAAQTQLIDTLLDELGDEAATQLDYIVGTTVSAEAAVSVLRQRGLNRSIKVLAYYYGPGVHRGIQRGTIIAAPTDSNVIQARMAIDMMVRILEGKPSFRHAAPRVIVVDRNNINAWDSSTTLPPRGFRAVFSVED